MIPNRKFYHDCLFFYFLFLVFSLTTSVLWSLCEQLNLICIVVKRELMCQFPVNQVLRVNNRVLHRDSNPELVYSQKRQTAYQQGSQRQVIPYCFLVFLNTSDVEISNYSFSPINCILQICEKSGFSKLAVNFMVYRNFHVNFGIPTFFNSWDWIVYTDVQKN